MVVVIIAVVVVIVYYHKKLNFRTVSKDDSGYSIQLKQQKGDIT